MREAGQAPEVLRRTGVSDHVTGMVHVQRLKVVVDGMTHHHLALKYSEDLQQENYTIYAVQIVC